MAPAAIATTYTWNAKPSPVGTPKIAGRGTPVIPSSAPSQDDWKAYGVEHLREGEREHDEVHAADPRREEADDERARGLRPAPGSRSAPTGPG